MKSFLSTFFLLITLISLSLAQKTPVDKKESPFRKIESPQESKQAPVSKYQEKGTAKTGKEALIAQECFAPFVQIESSTASELVFRINITCLQFTDVTLNGNTYQAFNIDPKFLVQGEEYASKPQTIQYVTQVALPLDAGTPSVTIEGMGKANTQKGVFLPPTSLMQITKGEGENTKTRIYTDESAYSANNMTYTEIPPSEKVAGGAVNIHRIKLNLIDYFAKDHVIRYHNTYRVSIKFNASGTCFRETGSYSGDFKADKLDELTNSRLPKGYEGIMNKDMLLTKSCKGSETQSIPGANLLVIYDPAFSAAANSLKTHKEGLGIRTTLLSTKEINQKFGTPGKVISDVTLKKGILDYYSKSFLKPEWLLLFGDVESIPTHYNKSLPAGSAYAAGDQFYGQLSDSNLEVPLMAIGRLPADDAEQANTMVNRIMSYEMTEYTTGNSNSSGYMLAVSFASKDSKTEPVDQAWFFTDKARTFLSGNASKIKAYYQGNPQNSVSEAGEKDAPLRWNGNNRDIIQDFSQEPSVLIARGIKGSQSSLQAEDIKAASFQANASPFIVSLNSWTTVFDSETLAQGQVPGAAPVPASWKEAILPAESFVQAKVGPTGIICNSRESDLAFDNLLMFGIIDAMEPSLSISGAFTPILDQGSILQSAKAFALNSAASASTIIRGNTIYNLLGDPSLQIRKGGTLVYLSDFIVKDGKWDVVMEGKSMAKKEGASGLAQKLSVSGSKENSAPLIARIVVVDKQTGKPVYRDFIYNGSRKSIQVPEGLKGTYEVRIVHPTAGLLVREITF